MCQTVNHSSLLLNGSVGFKIVSPIAVSLLFWYMGMIPDLATIRDRVPMIFEERMSKAKTALQQGFERFYFTFRKFFYGILAMGWRGSNRHWSNYEMAYLLLAGLSTPLVLSVHTVVSFDFAVANLPGWHTTIFPPYFVAGAIYSGFGMVITLMIIARTLFGIRRHVVIRYSEVGISTPRFAPSNTQAFESLR